MSNNYTSVQRRGVDFSSLFDRPAVAQRSQPKKTLLDFEREAREKKMYNDDGEKKTEQELKNDRLREKFDASKKRKEREKREFDRKQHALKLARNDGNISTFFKGKGWESADPRHAHKAAKVRQTEVIVIEEEEEEGEKVVQVTLAPPDFAPVDEDDMFVDNTMARHIGARLNQEYRRVTAPYKFGCGNQPECTYSLHRHDEDDTPLGLSRKNGKNVTDKTYRTLTPLDPFNSSNVPQLSTLSSFMEGMQRQNDDYKQMQNIAAGNVSSIIMRNRRLFHTELGNIQLDLKANRKEIFDRYRDPINTSSHQENRRLYSELCKARDVELSTQSRLFDREKEMIEDAFYSATVRTIRNARGKKFALNEQTTVAAMMDIITLDSGSVRDDSFFEALAYDVMTGYLDNLVAEIQRCKEKDGDLSMDRFSSDMSRRTTFVRPGKRSAPIVVEQELAQPHLVSLTRDIKLVCDSQNSARVVNVACSPICMFVAVDCVLAESVDIDYDRALWSGIDVWRQWYAYHSKKAKSNYMLATEVLQSPSFSLHGMESEEFGGFLHEPQAAGGSGVDLREILVAKQKRGIFAGAFTANATTCAIIYVDKKYYLFDSHGVHDPEKSSLARFGSIDAMIQYILLRFPARHLTTDVHDELKSTVERSYSIFFVLK